MFTHRTAIRSAIIVSVLSLGAVACGSSTPTRAELLEALDKAGLDEPTSTCVADKIMDDEELLKKTAKGEQSSELVDVMTTCMLGGDTETRSSLVDGLLGAGLDQAAADCVADKIGNDAELIRAAVDPKSPEIVDIVTNCMLGSSPTTSATLGADEPATTALLAPVTTAAGEPDATLTVPTLPPDPTQTTLADGVGSGTTIPIGPTPSGPDAGLMTTWQQATATLQAADFADNCAAAEAMRVWASTDYPTTLEGGYTLNIFETNIVARMMGAFATDAAKIEVYNTALTKLSEAYSFFTPEEFLANDKAAFDSVKDQIAADLAALGC